VTCSAQRARPFLKWAGGKTQLLSALTSSLPQQFGVYFEPFLGSGALFFHLAPPEAVLNDSNEELINAFLVVRDNVDELITELAAHRNDPEYYYYVRSLAPETMRPVQRASRLIYLNRTCFNGLYRVNKKNQFNTPFGRYVNPKICDEEGLTCASDALAGATILSMDYTEAVRSAKAGDFVYLDPPYLPISKYSDFKRYTKEFFYEEDHVRLAELFRDLDGRGCYVMLSNCYHPSVLRLYEGYQIDQVMARRLINKDPAGRQGVPELIVRNY